VQIIYRTPEGGMKERLLLTTDEPTISVAVEERPFSFDGDGAAFQLACEAKRIDLAFLFDPMMAVHTSNVEPLPHQITAVYESMLPRQPLRFVLAYDPGAGKTIMAGLYIRELIMRADAHRVVIIAPGSLVEQWRDELFEKLGLEFSIYSPVLEQASPSGNPFDSHHHLIVRLDQLSWNEDLQNKLCAAGWDLAVFDEAHKLAAHYFGSKLEKTGRLTACTNASQSRAIACESSKSFAASSSAAVNRMRNSPGKSSMPEGREAMVRLRVPGVTGIWTWRAGCSCTASS
jgi:Type III restriction enzyme, res subunit